MIEKHFMTAYFTADRYFPAFMQHIHAGYTPEDAVFHAELDAHADAIEEPPKKAPKAKEEAKPSAPASDDSSRPSTLGSRVRPSSKRTRKKGGGEKAGQDELPL
jgi:hypothetical protein